jgi:hypothetical protein
LIHIPLTSGPYSGTGALRSEGTKDSIKAVLEGVILGSLTSIVLGPGVQNTYDTLGLPSMIRK